MDVSLQETLPAHVLIVLLASRETSRIPRPSDAPSLLPSRQTNAATMLHSPVQFTSPQDDLNTQIGILKRLPFRSQMWMVKVSGELTGRLEASSKCETPLSQTHTTVPVGLDKIVEVSGVN